MESQYRFSPQELTGCSRAHIADLAAPTCSLHHAVMPPFLELRAAAARDGIDLLPASSFRDFDRQLAIWNGKCSGERPLHNASGELLDARKLDEDQLVDAILEWSALPGASRHHWGTDLDVIDAAAMPAGYRPQLVPGEYASDGVFGRLSDWLDTHAALYGFFRPYEVYRGGVRREPWHLSYAPVAQAALQQYSVQVLQQALAGCELLARAAVMRALPRIVERYVRNIDVPPAKAIRAPRPA